MPKIFIAQTYTVKRVIELEVEGDPADSVAAWEEGNLTAPDYEDPRWTETRTLRGEECGPGSAGQ